MRKEWIIPILRWGIGHGILIAGIISFLCFCLLITEGMRRYEHMCVLEWALMDFDLANVNRHTWEKVYLYAKNGNYWTFWIAVKDQLSYIYAGLDVQKDGRYKICRVLFVAAVVYQLDKEQIPLKKGLCSMIPKEIIKTRLFWQIAHHNRNLTKRIFIKPDLSSLREG